MSALLRTALDWEYGCGNRILDTLPDDERERIVPGLQATRLDYGAVVHAPGKSSDFVIFPIDAVLSIMATLASGEGCEVGTIGNEGVSGIEPAFGESVSRATVCQFAGTVGYLERADFLRAFRRNPIFAGRIRKSEKVRAFSIEQLVLCNAFHLVEQRCARWILAIADRTMAERYTLTHEYLSSMLGVQRPAISIAETRLRDAGAIAYGRGFFSIVDRALLESLACECYGMTRGVQDDTWNASDESPPHPSPTTGSTP